ncbi:hypothetical protein [Streptomyces sp. NBC_01235]|nr:hypothetical protein OG289_29615 [Streptomyces sp. NBC_01235]
MTSHVVSRPGTRYTGPLLIVLIATSCDFVIGLAVATAPADP